MKQRRYTQLSPRDFSWMSDNEKLVWEIENNESITEGPLSNFGLLWKFIDLLNITTNASGEFVIDGMVMPPEKVLQSIVTLAADIPGYRLPMSESILRHIINEIRDKGIQEARENLIGYIHTDIPEEKYLPEIEKLSDIGVEPQHKELVAPIILNFMWQVKRKMKKIPVTNHLMPILYGGQGSGKSCFIRQIIEPLADFAIDANFNMVQDERNISIWNNYVFLFDEMQYASKSDWGAIKNKITTPKLDMRVLYSNNTCKIDNNATFIGTSNDIGLDQSITDATGNRRFIGLNVLPKMNWDLINSIDFLSIWRSVDATGKDPIDIAGVRNLISNEQAATKWQSSVEVWLETESILINWTSSKYAYESYRRWSSENGTEKYFQDIISFGKEMKRISKHHHDYLDIKRSNDGMHYKKAID